MTRQVEINGQTFVLHQRYAIDVLKIMKMESETFADELHVLSVAISDALVDNWKSLKGRKQKRVKEILSPSGLLKNCTIAELSDLWAMVAEIEGLETSTQTGASKKK